MNKSFLKYKHLEYEVLIHKDKHRDARVWCKERFGIPWVVIGGRAGRWCMFWGGRDNFNQYIFRFAYQQDLTMFILRWA